MLATRYKSSTENSFGVQVAELAFVQAELACGEISKASFCGAALPLAKSLASNETSLYKAGVGSVDDLVKAQKQVREIQASCAK
jgi:hypothetical protein